METAVRMAAVTTSTVLALAAAGCGGRDDDNPIVEPARTSTVQERHPDHKACMISDSDGFHDRSVNQIAHDGLLDAKENLGVQTAEIESTSNGGFVDDIAELVKQKCNTIVTVGSQVGFATAAVAKKYPDVDFAIVDFEFEAPEENAKGLVFDTGAPSYLAGYLAAGMTKTGVVGTGGAPIASAIAAMDGFAAGVARHNVDNGTEVKVVGWNPTTQKSSFPAFERDGAKIGGELISQGADIIFPVLGPGGLGALAEAKEKGAKAIWVGADGCVLAPEFCDILLTSVVKGMDVAVLESIRDSANDTFTRSPYVGTLANGGVDLAPYREAEETIPDDLKAQVEELKKQLIDGTLNVG